MKEYIVSLTDEARAALQDLTRRGTTSARSIKRAWILLKSDEGWTDAEIAAEFDCGLRTVAEIRERFCARGWQGTVVDAPRSGKPETFTVKQRQQVAALACTDPPEGRSRWTLELLCREAQAQGLVESVSKSEVALWLQEHDVQPWRKKNVVRPGAVAGVPRANGRRVGTVRAAVRPR